MPIVKIKLVAGCDEETKARLGREVAAAVAEITVNAIADVHVLIDEVDPANWGRGLEPATQTPAEKVVRAEHASISYIRYSPETEREYLDLRRDVINPGMATQHGFVSSLLLRRHDIADEYLLINQWLAAGDDARYSAGPVHDRLKEQALALLPQPLRNVDTDIVHLDRAAV